MSAVQRLSPRDRETVRSIVHTLVTLPSYFVQLYGMLPRARARKSSATTSDGISPAKVRGIHPVCFGAAVERIALCCAVSQLSVACVVCFCHYRAMCINSWRSTSSFATRAFAPRTVSGRMSVPPPVLCTHIMQAGGNVADGGSFSLCVLCAVLFPPV